jgi:choline dehydrogenase-like flavoprotein
VGGLPTPSALIKDSYEAIVLGSGFGGAVASCRLAQAGVDVALLERGRRFEPGSFPRPPRAYLGSVALRHDVMSWHQGGAYDVKGLNDVLVVQAAGYGGGSLIYANVQMRPPPDVFDDGWPRGYSRAALNPYYDLVAHMLDVRPVEPDPATGELPPKTRLMEEAATRLGRRAQFFLSRFVQTHVRVYWDDGAIQVELWEHPRTAPRRLRVAERLAVAGRFPAQPDGDPAPRVRARTSLGAGRSSRITRG